MRKGDWWFVPHGESEEYGETRQCQNFPMFHTFPKRTTKISFSKIIWGSKKRDKKQKKLNLATEISDFHKDFSLDVERSDLHKRHRESEEFERIFS